MRPCFGKTSAISPFCWCPDLVKRFLVGDLVTSDTPHYSFFLRGFVESPLGVHVPRMPAGKDLVKRFLLVDLVKPR